MEEKPEHAWGMTSSYGAWNFRFWYQKESLIAAAQAKDMWKGPLK